MLKGDCAGTAFAGCLAPSHRALRRTQLECRHCTPKPIPFTLWDILSPCAVCRVWSPPDDTSRSCAALIVL